MKQAELAETFEAVLLSYVDMCYSVAFALTRDPYDARDLARDVVTWAWLLHDSAEGKSGIKMKLLTALRRRFLQHYRHPHLLPGKRSPCLEVSICRGRDAEQNTEKVSLEVQTSTWSD